MLKKSFCFGLLLFSQNSFSTTYSYPDLAEDSLIGKYFDIPFIVYARHEDTLLDIAREYDIGQNEIIKANPEIDRWLPGEDAKIRIPDQRLLPDSPRSGIVLNLAEYRLYFYPEPEQEKPRTIITHPISIGRVDWETPLGETRIIAKTENPVWRPPKSIKEEHAAEGDILPDVYPAGPDNPLGLFAFRLAIPGYLIHSTNKPYGVGMRVSHGCIRMYPEDIEKLFPLVEVDTPVYIVNQDIKVGWLNDKLYIEVHPNIEAETPSYEQRLNKALDLIVQANKGIIPVLNGKVLKQAIADSNGIPVAITKRINRSYTYP